MDAAPENRANEFTLWASLEFDAHMYQDNVFPETHWGDKAYQIGYGGDQGQSYYDYI